MDETLEQTWSKHIRILTFNELNISFRV